MSQNYNDIYYRSLNGEKRHVIKKRKKTKIVDYKKFAKSLLIIALALVVGGKGVSKISDKISRDIALNRANEYMRTKIVTYLENSDLDYSVLDDKIIFENDQDKLNKFVELLKTDGFSRDEIFYMVSQVCEQKDFDNIVKTSAWKDSEDFLYDRYSEKTLSSRGEIIGGTGSYGMFENNVELDYVESVNDLKEMEENKGLNR